MKYVKNKKGGQNQKEVNRNPTTTNNEGAIMGLLNKLFKNMPNKMERELRQEGLELRKKHNEDCLKKIQELYPNKNITELMKMAEQMTQEYEQMMGQGMGYHNPKNYNDYWELAVALEHYEKTGDKTKYIYVKNKSITK